MDPNVALEIAQLLALYREYCKSCERRFSVHPINQKRPELGQFQTLVQELKSDEQRWHSYTRMSLAAFDKLLNLVKDRLIKRGGRYLCPEERLLIALRFLSQGDSFHSLSASFRIGVSTACEISHEVCRVLAEALAPTYLTTPSTADEWRQISDGFAGKWQLPNALGAIDGKHVRIKAPANSGSQYFNYKQYFSTVLMVVADYRSRIIYAHFGSYGHESDGGIWDRLDFNRMISAPQNPLNLPPSVALPGTLDIMPYYFIGDGAFPLHVHVMKPFAQRNLTDEKRIYNYRISRARRVVESTFGIMAAKWRILLKPIETSVQNADYIVKAICCLHNFLIEEGEAGQTVSEEDIHEGETLRQAQIRNVNANRASDDATELRNMLVSFFNGVGSVPWQEEMI